MQQKISLDVSLHQALGMAPYSLTLAWFASLCKVTQSPWQSSPFFFHSFWLYSPHLPPRGSAHSCCCCFLAIANALLFLSSLSLAFTYQLYTDSSQIQDFSTSFSPEAHTHLSNCLSAFLLRHLSHIRLRFLKPNQTCSSDHFPAQWQAVLNVTVILTSSPSLTLDIHPIHSSFWLNFQVDPDSHHFLHPRHGHPGPSHHHLLLDYRSHVPVRLPVSTLTPLPLRHQSSPFKSQTVSLLIKTLRWYPISLKSHSRIFFKNLQDPSCSALQLHLSFIRHLLYHHHPWVISVQQNWLPCCSLHTPSAQPSTQDDLPHVSV